MERIELILIGLVIIVIVILGHLRCNRISKSIDTLEIENKLLKSALTEGKETIKFEIYQGNNTLIVRGVFASSTSFDTPACRLYYKTESTSIIDSRGNINKFMGILIDNKSE